LKLKYFFLIFCCVLFSLFSKAEDSKYDSLIFVLKQYRLNKLELNQSTISLKDSGLVKLLDKLSNTCIDLYKYEEAHQYINEAIEYANKIKYKIGVAKSHATKAKIYYSEYQNEAALDEFFKALKINELIGNRREVVDIKSKIGLTYTRLNNHLKAMDFLNSSLDESKKIGYILGIAKAYDRIGNAYSNIGNYSKSSKNTYEALRYFERINDKKGVADCYRELSFVNGKLNNYDEAIKQINLALILDTQLGSTLHVADCYAKLGVFNVLNGNKKKAFENFEYALKTYEEANNIAGIALIKYNLGVFYFENLNYHKAKSLFLESYKLYEGINDKDGVSQCLNQIGEFNLKQGNLEDATNYFQKGLLLSKVIDNKEHIMISYQGLYQVDSTKHNYKGAWENHKMYILYKDSLQHEANKKEVMEQTLRFEFEKKTASDSIANAKEIEIKNEALAKQQAEIKLKRIQQYAFLGSSLLLAVFAGFVFNRYKLSQKQNQIIKEKEKETFYQKQVIESKHKEITGSIEYAKRIQTAILPPPRIVKEFLKNSFILYLPKDIVAGDFYWMESVDDKIYFAACDCTGHGVPGAMVSVVCNTALSRSLNEFGLRNTGEIFDQTRALVLDNFAKSDEEVQDGMDASLAALDVTTRKLMWSGANNPLWIYRTADKTIQEIKADKQPIGKGHNNTPFSSYELSLYEGDIIYLFTDGYADQFGGERGKKLTKAKFREKLLSIAPLPMEEQRKELLDFHDSYRGGLAQVDDICVIGVRV
jgi:tetratricopeptide (TPR) repeat protein